MTSLNSPQNFEVSAALYRPEASFRPKSEQLVFLWVWGSVMQPQHFEQLAQNWIGEGKDSSPLRLYRDMQVLASRSCINHSGWTFGPKNVPSSWSSLSQAQFIENRDLRAPEFWLALWQKPRTNVFTWRLALRLGYSSLGIRRVSQGPWLTLDLVVKKSKSPAMEQLHRFIKASVSKLPREKQVLLKRFVAKIPYLHTKLPAALGHIQAYLRKPREHKPWHMDDLPGTNSLRVWESSVHPHTVRSKAHPPKQVNRLVRQTRGPGLTWQLRSLAVPPKSGVVKWDLQLSFELRSGTWNSWKKSLEISNVLTDPWWPKREMKVSSPHHAKRLDAYIREQSILRILHETLDPMPTLGKNFSSSLGPKELLLLADLSSPVHVECLKQILALLERSPLQKVIAKEIHKSVLQIFHAEEEMNIHAA